MTIDGAEDDLEFETRLYTLDGSAGITDSPFEAVYRVYDVAWSNPDGTSEIETYFELDDPIDLETWETVWRQLLLRRGDERIRVCHRADGAGTGQQRL